MDTLQLVFKSGEAEGRTEEKAKALEILKNYIQKQSALLGKELTNEEAFKEAEKVYNSYGEGKSNRE